jgi:hypothetical protein
MPEPLLGKGEVPLVSAINVGTLVGMLILTARTITHLHAKERTGGGLLGASWP